MDVLTSDGGFGKIQNCGAKCAVLDQAQELFAHWRVNVLEVFLGDKAARLPHDRSRRAISKREGMRGLLNGDLLP